MQSYHLFISEGRSVMRESGYFSRLRELLTNQRSGRKGGSRKTAAREARLSLQDGTA